MAKCFPSIASVLVLSAFASGASAQVGNLMSPMEFCAGLAADVRATARACQGIAVLDVDQAVALGFIKASDVSPGVARIGVPAAALREIRNSAPQGARNPGPSDTPVQD